MSPFRKLLNAIGLTAQSAAGADFDMIYLLLASLADLDEAAGVPAETFPNNVARECLHRLSAYPGVGLERLKFLLNEFVQRYDR